MKKYTQLNTRNRKYRKVRSITVVKMKIKKGDKVKVITGKDKGKTGAVLRVYPRVQRVIIEGMNVHKRHTKKIGNQSGRIIEKSLPIHVSNVAKV